MMLSSKTGTSVPGPKSIDSDEDCEMDFNNHLDNTDQDIPAGQFPNAKSGPIAQFLNGMPDWMNMTSEDIHLIVESIPNPLEGHILPGISRQEAIKVNEGHQTHDRHYQIITLISYVNSCEYDIIYGDLPISNTISCLILIISYTMSYTMVYPMVDI
jgi:hypothetical protein